MSRKKKNELTPGMKLFGAYLDWGIRVMMVIWLLKITNVLE
jgi:hypothetical protein|tara:strand:- start:68 stop:190 length:123 start_codon:yes stop_codon:yes gene_type:complete